MTKEQYLLCSAEEGEDEPGFCGLLEELGVVVTIPTFDIIVLQVSRAAAPCVGIPYQFPDRRHCCALGAESWLLLVLASSTRSQS